MNVSPAVDPVHTGGPWYGVSVFGQPSEYMAYSILMFQCTTDCRSYLTLFSKKRARNYYDMYSVPVPIKMIIIFHFKIYNQAVTAHSLMFLYLHVPKYTAHVVLELSKRLTKSHFKTYQLSIATHNLSNQIVSGSRTLKYSQ